MRHITKVYPNGVVANDDASLSVRRGEIHAVAGENGAGKSTIMKVLYGAERADGEILINGEPVTVRSPRDANRLGIGMVYQHFMLVNEFTALENIYFGIEETGPAGVLKKEDMLKKAASLCEKYDMQLDLQQKCADMSVSTLQKVEILKVLARGAEIIILDEPTAVLTPQETEKLFDQLRRLRTDGYTVIIITHKLKEIKALCDRITVMRSGRTVGCYDVPEVTEEEISRLMVGRDVSLDRVPPETEPGETVLSVKNLSVKGAGEKKAVSDISFSLRRGEILCVAGVEGNGQKETVDAITGAISAFDGSISFMGEDVSKLRKKKLRSLGMAHIPEDRIKTGCDIRSTIHENLIALDFEENSTFGFVKNRLLRARSLAQTEDYAVKGSLDTPLSMLSGGNMQKVVVARELDSAPVLIVADQPTRGIDVGAMETVHNRLRKMRDSGSAVLLVSADLSEVLSLADRILVFHEGTITAEITDIAGTDELQLGRYMLGLDRKERAE